MGDAGTAGWRHHHRLGFILLLTVLSLLLLPVGKAHAQQFAVKTNALMWALLNPNVEFEVVTGEYTSFDVTVFGHNRPYGLDSKMIALQPEFRYWFNGRPMTREFIGATLMMSRYDMTFNKKTFEGDAIGPGFIGGYVFNLGKRWNFELSGGVGVLFFRQKQFFKHDNYDDYFVDEAVKANAWGYKLFPMKLGVTFTYIIR